MNKQIVVGCILRTQLRQQTDQIVGMFLPHREDPLHHPAGGWQVYSKYCASCHAEGKSGPSLIGQLNRTIDYDGIHYVVMHGHKQGQIETTGMPAWKGSSEVVPHIDHLYQYLKARADDALPPCEPKLKPE